MLNKSKLEIFDELLARQTKPVPERGHMNYLSSPDMYLLQWLAGHLNDQQLVEAMPSEFTPSLYNMQEASRRYVHAIIPAYVLDRMREAYDESHDIPWDGSSGREDHTPDTRAPNHDYSIRGIRVDQLAGIRERLQAS